jgi:hypothetical protein
MPVVLGAHAALFPVDTGLLMFEARGFSGSELTALNALADAVLLIVAALPDARLKEESRGGSAGGGCSFESCIALVSASLNILNK